MPDLLQELTSMVRSMAPDYEYRWSEAVIHRAAHMADLAISEQAEALWTHYDINLVAGQATYDMPDDIIWLKNVQYCRDGVNFEVVLTPVVPQDFDRISPRWPDNTGSPTHYALLSQPGIAGYSKIILWRKLASISGEMIRLNYLQSRNDMDDIAVLNMPSHVIQDVYLPYVLSVMRAADEPQEAEMLMQNYRRGLQKVRSFYGSPGAERMTGLEMRP